MPQINSKSCLEADMQRRQFECDLVSLTPALRAFAIRFCRTTDDIDDLVQETLLKGLRHRNRFEPGTSLKSWLFTVMRNHFCTQYRNRKREPVTEGTKIELLLSILPGQEWSLHERDVEMAIERLPERQRTALMQVSSGVSYEDAARSIGCEVGTVKSRVNRARIKLTMDFSDLFMGTDPYTI